MTNNEHWIFLEELRRSGEVNMFGASIYVAEEFDIPYEEANRILIDWMKNYNPEDYRGGN